MSEDDKRAEAIRRQGRTAAIVIAGAMVLWMLAQFLGAKLGIAPRFMFLIDMATLAAFFWALVVTYQIWRLRRTN
ncbi:MAG: hypothetical protein CMM86_16225 [Rhodovulum sp.]|jgi:hypothetical protein|nr:hypothetical protein [Rhodovulum sp.]|tara:strand:+ start:1527 stop:1751 length:225 start_codon:yes stop_codon:yes gene_type:complete